MSKLVLWTSLIMTASIFIVLALLAVLLSELYCSVLRSCGEGQASDDEENQFQLPPADHSNHRISQQDDNLRLIGLMGSSPSPSISFQHHRYQQEKPSEFGTAQEVGKEGLVYISNPIYDHVVGNDGGSNYNSSESATPFETPESSPSRLETEDEDGDCEGDNKSPPLVPMKKLPFRAPSLTRSGTTDSNMASSSSHSFSPQCTSPSW